MSAHAELPSVVYLPSVRDESFLRNTAALLERLGSESELRGHPLLASLLAIAKGEVEDDLNTSAKALRVYTVAPDHDDGIASMAKKLVFQPNGGAL